LLVISLSAIKLSQSPGPEGVTGPGCMGLGPGQNPGPTNSQSATLDTGPAMKNEENIAVSER